jgi:hypothetical protein
MNSHREVELKRLLVGEGAAERLIQSLGLVVADKRQVNHLFDTGDGRLRQRHYSVRLRIEDESAILTAKGPAERLSNDVSVRDEAEANIDSALGAEILAGRRDPVAALRERVKNPAFAALWQGLSEASAGQEVGLIGAFENRRRVVRACLPSGLELNVEVDRTRFPDGHADDEVEIELPDIGLVPEVEAWLAGQARAAAVVTAPATAKLARFYAHRK